MSDADLSRANGMTQLVLNIGLAAGAGGAGFLLAAAGAPTLFGILAVLAGTASGMTLLLPAAALDHAEGLDRGTWISELREGLQAVTAVRQLRLLLLLGALSVLGFAPALVALVALVDKRIGAGPDALGVRGRVLSTAMSVIEVPRLAAPVIGGALVDSVGVTALYAGMGVLIAAAGLGALALRGALETSVAPPEAATPGAS